MKYIHRTVMVLAFMAICAFSLMDNRVNATPVQSAEHARDRYSWAGGLVALDEGAQTVTVKALVVGNQAPVEFGQLKPGDKVSLHWSGHDESAVTISGASRPDPVKKSDARFTFPVEFVSFDASQQNVTFRLRVTPGAIQGFKALKPGEWFRATSRHQPAGENDVVMNVVPYLGSSTRG
jgi:hypothetical protein